MCERSRGVRPGEPAAVVQDEQFASAEPGDEGVRILGGGPGDLADASRPRGALPGDEPWTEDERVPTRRAPDRVAEAGPGFRSELASRDGHRAQRGHRERGERDVVESDHAQVGGHGHAGLAQRRHEPEGDEVVEGDHGGRVQRQHGVHGRSAVDQCGARGDDVDGELPVRSDRTRDADPAEAVALAGGRPRQVHDPPVPEGRQFGEDLLHPARVVDRHRGHRRVGELAVDEDHRVELGEQGAQFRFGQAR